MEIHHGNSVSVKRQAANNGREDKEQKLNDGSEQFCLCQCFSRFFWELL